MSEKSNKYPDILTDDVAEMSSNFLIQELEDKAKARGLNIHIYVDTKDIIEMIRGIYSFIETGSLNIQKFNKNRPSIVHGFIYRKWLKNIHILPPHQDEFLQKLSEPHIFNVALDNKEHIENDFFYKLRFADLKFEQHLLEDFNHFKKYIKSIKQEAVNLFKADFVLQHEMSWVNRYKYLFEESKTLKYDEETFEVDSSNNQYLLFLSAMRKARSKRKKNLSINNHLDATALCCLQYKLEDWDRNGRTGSLPIFYASSPSMYRELKKLIEEQRTAQSEERSGVKLLCYYAESVDDYIPIIRSTDYFILDVIYNKLQNGSDDSLHQYFEQIHELKKSLKNQFDTFFRRDLAKSGIKDIKQLTLTSFFEKIWMHEGYEELHNSIQGFLSYQQMEKKKDTVEDILQKEKDRILRNIPRNSRRVHLFHEVWIALEAGFRSSGEILGSAKVIKNYYNDLGLMRFSFDSFKDETGKLVLVEKIQTTLKGIFRDLAESEEVSTNLGNRISLIASYASNTNFPEQEKVSENLAYQNFLLSLSVLWVFNQYELIVRICDDFNKKYPSYHTAVLHGSALFLGNDEQKSTKGLEILECIESKVKGKDLDHHKVWISLAYMYFRVWEDKIEYSEFPEIASTLEKERFNDPEIKVYFESALDYIKKAKDWLESNKRKVPEKESYRVPKYHYVLNNYIYYVTRGGDVEEFKLLEDWVNILERSKSNGYWQVRFHDTLAWHYLRKALIAHKTKRLFKHNLLKAKEEAEEAISKKGKGARNQKEQDLFERIFKLIKKVIIEGHEGQHFTDEEVDQMIGYKKPAP